MVLKQLSISMAGSGHGVMLVGNGGEGMDRLADLGVDYRELDWARDIPSLLRCVGRLRRLFRTFRPDIVHVHGRGPSLMCMLAGRKPDWFTLHNTQLTDQVGAMDAGMLRKYLSPLARRVIVLDQSAYCYVTKNLNVRPKHVEIIGNGVDCARFRPPSETERLEARARFGIRGQDTMALFVGRFHEQKQPETVLFLAAAARESGLDSARFILIGGGHLEEKLRELSRSLNVSDICSIHAWSDPLPAYWAADVLLMPSLYEGFGLVAAEALACGCPVVRTKSGGYEIMIREGITGHASETDRDSFVKLGLDVLGNRDALNGMRPAARSWAVENLSVDKQTEQTVAAYFRHMK